MAAFLEGMHAQAFPSVGSERMGAPVMAEVDAYLPPFEPVQVLDPDQPVTIGAMVGPEAFMEVRYLAHHKHLRALEAIPELSAEFAERFGRASGGLIDGYRAEDAETVIVALGSVNGTIKDVVDDMRGAGMKAGAVKIVAFRPFPLAALRAALEGARRVVVIEKDLALGLGGTVASNLRMCLRGLATPVYTVIAGLGGRAITQAALSRAFAEAHADKFEDPHFLDLDWPAIDRELARAKDKRRSGPVAENILRDLGLVGHKVH